MQATAIGRTSPGRRGPRAHRFLSWTDLARAGGSTTVLTSGWPTGVRAISPFRPFAENGGLMAYGPDLTDFFRRCASFVAKLLEGARASELPIEQPTRFEMVLNAGSAAALGLTLPSDLLLRADDVIR